MNASIRPWLAPLLLTLLPACGDEPRDPEELSRLTSAGSVPTLVFTAGWKQWATTPPQASGQVAVDYDEARLPRCRAWHNGNPGWQIMAYLRVLPGGAVSEKPLFAHASTPTGPDYHSWVKQVPLFDLPAGTTAVELWFKNTSGLDQLCTAWDSAFGKNYRFAVTTAPAGPTLTFRKDWTIARDGTLARGGPLLVRYDPARLQAIAQGPSGGMGYFASKYHCYGYGCCEHDYEVTLRVRFRPSGDFTAYPLSGPVQLVIPPHASRVELFFEAEVMTEVWYCGGTSGPRTTVGPDRFFDSNYGHNFVFTL